MTHLYFLSTPLSMKIFSLNYFLNIFTIDKVIIIRAIINIALQNICYRTRFSKMYLQETVMYSRLMHICFSHNSNKLTIIYFTLNSIHKRRLINFIILEIADSIRTKLYCIIFQFFINKKN